MPLKILSTMSLLATLLMTISYGMTNAATIPKPHIVLIVADDLGWNDVSWHNPGVVTPHLEELALGGVILNQSYVQPICTPTRSALLTGRYPYTIGRQRSTLRPSEPTGLTLNATLLPQALKKVGYTTHAVGKWHLGYCAWEYTPTYRGFDTFYGYYNGAEDYFTHLRSNLRDPSDKRHTPFTGDEHFGLDLRNNTEPDPNKEGIYSPHLFASYIEDLLGSRNPSEPMFLYLPFQNVHAPLMVPHNYTKPYRHIHDFDRRIYLGMVTALDEAVGRVVKALKTSGHYDNTVIVFTTDNGGTCKHGGNNWPLRGMKSTLWEGGTRGVAFVHSPLLPNPGTVSHKLIHATDWFPTLAGLGGAVAPSDTDGFDQWEAITSSSPSPRHHMVYNIDATTNFRAGVRTGHYKLLVGNPGESAWTPPPDIRKKEEVSEAKTERVNHSLLNEKPGFPLTQERYILDGIYSDLASNSSHVMTGANKKSKLLKGHLDKAFSDVSVTHPNSQNIHFNSKLESNDVILALQENPSTRTSFRTSGISVSSKKPFHTAIKKGRRRKISIDDSPQVTKITNPSKKMPKLKKVHRDISRSKREKPHVRKEKLLLLDSVGVENVRGDLIANDNEITWEYLIRNYLVDNTWLDQLRQQGDIIKNETEIRLYNIKDDPEERHNLAEKKIHRVKILLEFLLGELVNRYVPADILPEVPTANPKYWNNTWSPGWCHAK